MKKSLLLGLVAGFLGLSASAQDFTYEGLNYSVVDANAKTVMTKKGTNTAAANSVDALGITQLVIPEKVTYNGAEYTVVQIGSYSFNNYDGTNDNLISVELPATVATISSNCFYYCKNLEQVIIRYPNGKVASTTSNFKDISPNAVLLVPADVVSAYEANDSFKGWFGDRIYAIGSTNYVPDFIYNGIKYTVTDKDQKLCQTRANTTITGSSNSFDSEEFQGNTYVSGEVEIPSVVTNLYNGVEYTVTEIGEGSFYYAENMTNITLPNTLTEIGKYAFMYCDFDSIVLPESVQEIGEAVFYVCQNLTSLTYFREEPPTLTTNSYLFIPTDQCSLYLPKDYIELYENTNASTYQWSYYFKEMLPINFVNGGISYTILNANQVETTEGEPEEYEGYVYYLAGEINSELKGNITIPSTISYEGNNYTVVGIGTGSFAYNENLTGVTLPETITYIGESGFDYTTISTINLPDGLQTIGAYAFFDTYLSSIEIPGSVKEISEGAFYYCGDLTSLTLNEGLVTIGALAFEDTAFTSVVIPSSVTTIGEEAFASYNEDTETVVTRDFTSVTSYATTAPTCGENAFYMYNWCPLYVPKVAVASYASANVWKNFTISALDWTPATAENFDVEANVAEDVITIVITSEDCTEFAVVGEKVTIAGNAVNVTSAQVSGEEKNVLTISVAVPEDAEEGEELAITVPAGFFTCTYDSLTSESPALNTTVEVPETDDNTGSGDNNGDDNNGDDNNGDDNNGGDNNGDDNNGDDNNGDDNMGSSAVDSILTEGHDVIYNLQGVRVDSNKLTRGIYIINGKKVMIK